jgi:hypothetical protein
MLNQKHPIIMIKPFTKALTLLLFSAATLTACKKNKEDNLAVTQENLAGTYTLASIKLGGSDVNLVNEMDACERDDEYVLHADNRFEYKDVGTKCDDDYSYEDEWFIENNILNMVEYAGVIKKLSNKSLVIEATEIYNNEVVTATLTFNRK